MSWSYSFEDGKLPPGNWTEWQIVDGQLRLRDGVNWAENRWYLHPGFGTSQPKYGVDRIKYSFDLYTDGWGRGGFGVGSCEPNSRGVCENRGGIGTDLYQSSKWVVGKGYVQDEIRGYTVTGGGVSGEGQFYNERRHLANSLGIGPVRVNATFQMGRLLEAKVIDLGTGQSFGGYDIKSGNGRWSANRELQYLRLSLSRGGAGATPLARAPAIDNLRLEVENRTQVFGIFSGTRTGSPNSTATADLAAKDLVNLFNERGYFATSLTGNDFTGEHFTQADLRAKLDSLRPAGLQAGDTIVLSFTGHGGSLAPSGPEGSRLGIGHEFIDLGPGVLNDLTDYQLAEMIEKFDPARQYRWRIFTDACHSGGLWDTTGIGEDSDKLSLRSLGNVELLAAAGEAQSAFFAPNTPGLFTMAFQDAVKAGWLEDLLPSELAAKMQERANAYAKQYAQERSDFVLYSLDDRVDEAPIFARDYVARFAAFTSPVPEPSIWLMLLVGGSLLVGCHRMRY